LIPMRRERMPPAESILARRSSEVHPGALPLNLVSRRQRLNPLELLSARAFSGIKVVPRLALVLLRMRVFIFY